MLQRFISWRRLFQLGLGVGMWFLVAQLGVSLWIIIGVASAAGILLGKFFCRWMCPLGFLMETVTGVDPSGKQASLYQYFKVGCPIAWAGGLLNRVSLLRVRRRPKTACTACARCDEACYIASNNASYSLFKGGKSNPSTHFACSRCLQCVTACPTGRITVGTLLGDRSAPRSAPTGS